MRNSRFWWVLIGLMVMIDLYVFFAMRSLFTFSSNKVKTAFGITYWCISILSLLVILLLPYFQITEQNKSFRNGLFAFGFALFFGKLLAALFFLVDDIRRLGIWVLSKVFNRNTDLESVASAGGENITRSTFLTWLGMAVGGTLFSTFLYGLSNKYNYKIKRVALSFVNLPASFKGMKVVQLSDIHSGSFTDTAAVNRGIDLILNEKPDLILFTGDIVNNKSEELIPYLETFSRLKAPMGVYSTLGNHDYGDYVPDWASPEAKKENLDTLKNMHAQMGWRLMLDEHLPITKNNETIGLVGVENISGKSNFHSYGSMAKAMQGAQYPFTILMSHDPSHWDSEVNKKYPQIDLMLSGHTHGMQFGVEIPWLKWSPIQYVYKQWGGLYEKANQKLYVNRGFGFLGYPGRVGIMPEITVFEFS